MGCEMFVQEHVRLVFTNILNKMRKRVVEK